MFRFVLFISALTVAGQAQRRIHSQDCTHWATDAEHIEGYSVVRGEPSGLSLPGVDKNFQFVTPGLWIEMAEGRARLTARARSLKNPRDLFDIDVSFSGRTAVAPKGSPNTLGLKPSVFAPQGQIDTVHWYYYTELSGVLVGRGDLEGAYLELTRRGPAFQIGFGANVRGPEFGGSGWFNAKVVRQPNNRTITPTGTGDISVIFGRCIGDYQLDGGRLSSSDDDPLTLAQNVAFGSPVGTTSNGVVLQKSSWKAAARNSAQYFRNRISMSLMPIAGRVLGINKVCLRLRRDDGSVVRAIDVRVNGITGAVASVSLPDTTATKAWQDVCIDLTNNWRLQGQVALTRIDLHLHGSAKSGCTDTEVDRICVRGFTTCCVPARTLVLKSADCRIAGAPTLMLESAPIVPSRPRVVVEAPRFPNAPTYLFASIGGSLGNIRFPDTGCRIWIDPDLWWLVRSFRLDAAGKHGFVWTIPDVALLRSLRFGLQAMVWATPGDSLSNGLVVQFGCL